MLTHDLRLACEVGCQSCGIETITCGICAISRSLESELNLIIGYLVGVQKFGELIVTVEEIHICSQKY